MNENPLKKASFAVGYFLLAAISCWATAESLQMLLPDLPSLLCWTITICFFVIASLGTKMMIDSLNQNIYVEKRGLRLIGGIVLVFVFWLFCSMPTNTHTFFFRNLVGNMVTKDVSTTQGLLAQIRDNTVTEGKIQAKCAEVRNKVDIKLGELEAEIMNDANPGFGPKAKDILRDFADILGVAKVDPLTYKGLAKQDRQRLCDAYRNKIYILMNNKIMNIRKEMTPPNDNYRKVADMSWKNLEIVKRAIDNEELCLTDADDIATICKRLDEGYVTVKTYKEFVNFQDEIQKDHYTKDNAETDVKRLLSVYDVWIDFVEGKFGGWKFAFWILISILVDIAAFVFFDLAFKKE